MNKRILVFIDWYKPGFRAGGPLTSLANLVDGLKDEYEFFILTRNTDYGSNIPYEGIEPDCWVNTEPQVNVCYISTEKLSRKFLTNKSIEAQCDLWFVNGIYSWFFSILPIWIGKKLAIPKLVVSPRGMLLPHAIAVKKLKKIFFIRAARILRLYKDIRFHSTSENEAEGLRHILGHQTSILIAPNLSSLRIQEPKIFLKDPGQLFLLFLGRVSKEKNTSKALQLLSQISSGEIVLHIAGEISDDGYFSECNKIISELPDHISVIFHGPLRDNKISALMGMAHFLFLPTSGENFGHAIIESMSQGLPAIISDQTPWNKIQAHGAGWAIPLDQEDQYIKILQQCREMDQDAFNKHSQAAIHFARRVIDDPQNLELNRKLFQYDSNRN